MASLLESQNISVTVRNNLLLDSINLKAEAGQILSLVGPNGAGKTTLLKALLGLIPHQGTVRVLGQPLKEMSFLERACQVAYVPQFTLLTARLTGREVVAQGRFAHDGNGYNETQIIDQALKDTDCETLADRPFGVCSGGERARLLLARALATEAPLLLLDEPTASLDQAHTLHLYELLKKLIANGKGIVLVQHQLAEALRWSDKVFVLNKGRQVICGTTTKVLTPLLIQEIFGLNIHYDGITFELAGKPN